MPEQTRLQLESGDLSLVLADRERGSVVQDELRGRGGRVLTAFAWRFLPTDDAPVHGPATLTTETHRCLTRVTMPARGDGDLVVTRDLRLRPDGFDERLDLENTGANRRSLAVELAFEAALVVGVDLHEVSVAVAASASTLTLRFDQLAAAHPGGADWELSLAPGERIALSASATLSGTDPVAGDAGSEE